MRVFEGSLRIAICTLVAAALGAMSAYAQSSSNENWPAEKADLSAFGKQYDTAWDLYLVLKEQAGGGTRPSYDELPDWRGLWTRAASPFFYDPDQTDMTQLPPGAKLKPEYEAELRDRIANRNSGNYYDPISAPGVPTGYPRWFTVPFLREFIPTPDQTWLIAEGQNQVRRVFTDGRPHVPEDLAYPLYLGDSIGFWDGDKLVVHTSQLRRNILQRIQPIQSEEAETVEIWQKVSDDLIQVDVWLYDPVVLEEPWYTRQSFARVPNDEHKSLRIRQWVWDNPNNEITQTGEGGSNFTDFTFTEEDDTQ